MESPAIYRWKADYFCRDCIVERLTAEPPWTLWVVQGHEVLSTPSNAEVEEQLDSIAEFFFLNRSNPVEVVRRSFPRRINEIPEPPDFCSSCLKWFSLPSDVRD